MIRYYVTDCRQADVLACAVRAVQNGVDMIQVREKDLSGRALFELVCKIRDLAVGTKTQVLVNDCLDIALAAGIDGIHLPANGLPAARARPFVKLLGVSTHTVEEAIDAERARADFIVFGPVQDSPGKTGVGFESLSKVVSSVSIPVLAIGGITEENASAAQRAGAAGIAGIRLFQN